MEPQSLTADCIRELNTLNRKGKSYGAFPELVTMLNNEVATNGLNDEQILLIIQIIIKNELGSQKLISLVKCLAPQYKMPEEPVKKLIAWCLGNDHEITITLNTIIIQWIAGLYEYQLVEVNIIDMFYDVFFYKMLKREKLERYIAYLIYVLTKPEDVTRRSVCRLLAHHQKYSKPQKHIIALLSLFKSYKPELVPEKIPSMNIESVWKPIPDTLRLNFKSAKQRSETRTIDKLGREAFNWNTFETGKKKKLEKQLVPSATYFQIGSNIFKEKETKSIFDIYSIEDLGKFHSSVELPSNAVSLLSNMVGYHLLTYADFQYQSRFAYNLYNTLTKAFLIENGKYSHAEMVKILEMTVQFLNYMQQGLLVVNLFFHEYLNLKMGEFEKQLLALFEWMIYISADELQEKILPHIRNIYYTSSVNGKCAVIKALRGLITNLFVTQGFDDSPYDKTGPFLGQGPIDPLEEIYPILIDFAQGLIISGLNIHVYDYTLLAEALLFYKQIYILEKGSRVPFFTVAPPAVIYGSFITKSCAILSSLCDLLTRYYKKSRAAAKKAETKELFKEILAVVSMCVHDITTALLHNETFSRRKEHYFLRRFPRSIMEDLEECDLDDMFNICHHYAFQPYKNTLRQTGFSIESLEDYLSVGNRYFPAVVKYLELNA